MSYHRVLIPAECRRDIYSWGLPRHQVVQVLTALHTDLPGREGELWRLAAPTPTRIYWVELPVEGEPGRVHAMTFYVVDGAEDGTLAVIQCDHAVTDELGEDEE